ncbi:MAG: flagellar hook-basal body complex protein [Lachnospiraceae bacterium]|nr:flagellar hook-basal body complex protein [Lachnospiraceae bacterium]
MMRSMYSGVAGLKTHQTKMDVIGNNIANVNTVAYKSQSVTFSELMYQTSQAASGANSVTGTAGINARQIGLGVKTGAINTAISSQGASQTTNNPFDIRITGDAFFIVGSGTGGERFFTRDGSFYVDGVGNLAMTSNGYNVMGWQVDPETQDIKRDTVSPLVIMSPENMTYPPEATTKATVSGILDKNDSNVLSSSGKTMNLLFYDKLGYSYTAKLNVKATDTEGVYTVQLDSIKDQNNSEYPIGDLKLGGGVEVEKNTALNLSDKWEVDASGQIVNKDDPTQIAFDGTNVVDWDLLAEAYNYSDSTELQSMKFTVVTDSTTDPVTTEDVTLEQILKNESVTVDGTATNLQSIYDITSLTSDKVTPTGSSLLEYNATTGAFKSIAGGTGVTLGLSQLDPIGRFDDIEIDFSTTTMYNNAGTSTIAAASGDVKKVGCGRKMGEMSGVSIQDDGRIYASYDNGMSKLLGQIAVAEFANASGLEKEGDNLYKATQNSGDFDGIGTEVKTGGGYMTTGVLEMSNVDLSAEFTDMITTQRGFQANSRIITVSDTLLEELVNLKR